VALQGWIRPGGARETLDEVLRAWRKRSALAASMQFDTISARAVAEIERTLASGGTLVEFKRAMETEAITLGISPAGPGYLENVYRTNVATAYGAGRFAQLNDPELLSARPYRQWRTSGDSRVRPECAMMHGVTWRVGNPAFANVATPRDFQDRCITISYSQADVDEEGIVISEAPPAGFFIRPGFGAVAFAR
jgi:SPP1 gp7 family putative phage head morphogenesis protein